MTYSLLSIGGIPRDNGRICVTHVGDLGAIIASIDQVLYPEMTAEAVWRRISVDMVMNV